LDIQKYWENIDASLEILMSNGVVKLPSIKEFGLNVLAQEISHEMGEDTFKALGASHQIFLDKLSIQKYLTPKLLALANNLGFQGEASDQYHIARRVMPGNSQEMYRAHFDSHLFTLVLPIRIPTPFNEGDAGDLIYFTQARNPPKSEVNNFLGKLYFKRFASKKGINKFASTHTKMTEDFLDYEPLLFIGNTTLHTNKQVSLDCSGFRLTLLAHFFDPSPKYGIGKALRMLRGR